MISAPVTPDEKERLNQLFGYEVLDTEAESEFDELTELASKICGTPIALISLVDPQRQWFKSKVGIDAEETERDIAFCAHAIHDSKIFEVEDTHLDPRFVDNPLVTSDPNIRFYAGSPLMTPSGHAIGTLCVISDKPQQLKPSQRDALNTLSKSVISLLELRRKNKALEKANKFKSDFLAYVSHELRTPLNAINTFSHKLAEEVNNYAVPPSFSQSIRHIEKSGMRLLEVVNAVLDHKKIEAGKMSLSLRPVAMHDFFEHLYSSIAVKAQEQGNPFTFSVDASVPEGLMADDTKLSQIMLNLLANAVKFTPEGKSVKSNVFYQKGLLHFVVEDKGIGISEEDQKLLFQAYQRVETERKYEGTGLGLVITKGLLQLMHGTMNLKSTLGLGTLIKISIPLEIAPAERFKEEEPNVLAQSLNIPGNTKILVVEDHEINQIVAKSIFESLGFDIDIVSNGESSIQSCSTNSYDVVFMDLELPGIAGTEAAEKIKQCCPKLPIVALTADVVVTKEYLAEKGIQYLLTKPIDQTQLVDTLNKCLVKR